MTDHAQAMLHSRHYAEAMRYRRAIAGLRAENAGLRVQVAERDRRIAELEACIAELHGLLDATNAYTRNLEVELDLCSLDGPC